MAVPEQSSFILKSGRPSAYSVELRNSLTSLLTAILARRSRLVRPRWGTPPRRLARFPGSPPVSGAGASRMLAGPFWEWSCRWGRE